MATLYDLLKMMIEKKASDLHITTGSSPRLRIDGKLVSIDHPSLAPADTKALCYSILTDAQKHKYEENNELDLSFGVKGLSRFRANIFMQRGAVAGAFRTIPFEIRRSRISGFRISSVSLLKNRAACSLLQGLQEAENLQHLQPWLIESIRKGMNTSSRWKTR